MKIKFALMVFALFCGSFAQATPIEYRFTNASDFTLAGVSYTGPYLGIPTNAPQLTFTFYGNTDNVFTSPSIGGFPGNIHNDIGTTTVSFGGTTLATLSDPFGILISPFGSTVDLVDEANGETILSDTIRSYNGTTNYSGPTSGGTPSSPIDTSVGQLVITGGGAYQGDFSASVTPAVPEPSAIVLLGTGALGFAGAFRRRMFAN
jgi:PEP-CTERM motif